MITLFEANNSVMNATDKDKLKKEIDDLEDEICALGDSLKDKEIEILRVKDKYIKEHGPLYLCRICNAPHEDQEFAENYNNLLICKECESRARTADNNEPFHNGGADDGDNPLFINGVKVWRRYRFGGFITLFDENDCKDVMEFYRENFGL